MRKRSIWSVAFVAALLILAIFVIYRERHHTRSDISPAAPAAEIAVVQRGSITQVLTLAGQFQPYQVVDVHPKVSGFMQKIFVDIGDKVHRGETLAILEVPELAAQVKGAVFEVSRSKDEITRARHEVSRAESEHQAVHLDNERLQQAAKQQPGLIAQQELDDALAKDLSSQEQVDAAKAALSAAEQGAQVANADQQRVSAIQDYTRVIAPLDGVIIWRYADTGALIQSGTASDSSTASLPIVKLSQSGLLRLRMPVPEDDVKYVHIGDQMQVRVDALGRSFVGKVVRFTRNVSLETRTMETEVDVENKNLTIDPGMYANTQLQLATAHNVLTLAGDALVRDGDEETVLVLDAGNHVHRRVVQTGIQGTRLTEITGGLQEGDRVILGGQSKYTEGEVVTPLLQYEPASEVSRQQGGMIDMRNDAGDEQ